MVINKKGCHRVNFMKKYLFYGKNFVYYMPLRNMRFNKIDFEN